MKKLKLDNNYSKHIPQDLGDMCIIIAIDSSSTYTGHMAFVLNPNTGDMKPLWLTEPSKSTDKHLINLERFGTNKPWPDTSAKLIEFHDQVALLEESYTNKMYAEGLADIDAKLTKFFVCESVFFGHMNSIAPLLRIQTIATMYYIKRGWIVFEHQNTSAKGLLGVPARVPKGSAFKSKDYVIPAINKLFGFDIPNKMDETFDATKSEKFYEEFTHIGDAIALSYFHARVVWQIIQQRKMLKDAGISVETKSNKKGKSSVKSS